MERPVSALYVTGRYTDGEAYRGRDAGYDTECVRNAMMYEEGVMAG
jgi:hypothetical protein